MKFGLTVSRALALSMPVNLGSIPAHARQLTGGRILKAVLVPDIASADPLSIKVVIGTEHKSSTVSLACAD